jgi:hypothetical protein
MPLFPRHLKIFYQPTPHKINMPADRRAACLTDC